MGKRNKVMGLAIRQRQAHSQRVHKNISSKFKNSKRKPRAAPQHAAAEPVRTPVSADGGGGELRGEVLQRHKRELREFKARVSAMRSAASKFPNSKDAKQRKRAAVREIRKLEQEFKARQATRATSTAATPPKPTRTKLFSP